MSNPDDGAAFDQQLLDVYIHGLQADLEDKLRQLREVQGTLKQLGQCGNAAAQCVAARGLAARFDQMLVVNRVVRETLVELRETARHLAQELEHAKPA